MSDNIEYSSMFRITLYSITRARLLRVSLFCRLIRHAVAMDDLFLYFAASPLHVLKAIPSFVFQD